MSPGENHENPGKQTDSCKRAANAQHFPTQGDNIHPDLVAWLSSCPVPLTDHLSALISALINHAIGSEDSAGAERTTVFSGDTRDDVLQQVAHALFPETDATDADDVDKGRCSNRILELGGRRIGNAARDAGQLAELIDGDLEREEANS